MGAMVARQPNGLLCRWSSVVDDITHYNMTDDEYVEMCVERAIERAREDAKDVLKRYLYSWDEIVREHEALMSAYNDLDDEDEEDKRTYEKERDRKQREWDDFVKVASTPIEETKNEECNENE